MDRQTATELLGVSESASPDEIELAFENAQHMVEKKLTQAPTPALRHKLRVKLKKNETAFELLSTVLSYNETPASTVKLIRQRENITTSERTSKREKRIREKSVFELLHPNDRQNIVARTRVVRIILVLLASSIGAMALFYFSGNIIWSEFAFILALFLYYINLMYFDKCQTRSSFCILAIYGSLVILTALYFVVNDLIIYNEENAFHISSIIIGIIIISSMVKRNIDGYKTGFSHLIFTVLSVWLVPKWLWQSGSQIVFEKHD